jgi:hypothetical protein
MEDTTIKIKLKNKSWKKELSIKRNKEAKDQIEH